MGLFRSLLSTMSAGGGGLPNDYQEVQYLIFDGASYIDTNWDITTGMIADIVVAPVDNSEQYLAGAVRISWPTLRSHLAIYSGEIQMGVGEYDYSSYISPTSNQVYHIVGCTISGNNYLNIDDVNYVTEDTTYNLTTDPQRCYVGAVEGLDLDKGLKGKMYSCLIYDETQTLIRNFVPCYRKSDSVIGMYDLVNGVFYTNSGYGTLDKGPDVV